MKSDYLRTKIGRILLAFSFLVTIGVVSSTAVQAQWRDRDNRRDQNQDYRRNRDEASRRNRDRVYQQNRDYRRNDQYSRNGGNGGYGNGGYGNGGYGNGSQVAVNQGYQDGLYTGSSDAQRGQSYNPQRSHYYRNANNGSGGYGNSGYYAQAYRQGFLSGYEAGYRRYGGNNRRGSYNRFPFPW